MNATTAILPPIKPKTLDNLQSLLQANIDSARGFEEVAADVADYHASRRFKDRAARRHDNATRLSQLIGEGGRAPKHEGSWLAAYHRNWIAVKAVLTSGKTEPLLAEIERGEQYLAERYQEALADDPSEEVASVLREQLDGVEESLSLAQAG